jgi:hypothetical protein
MECPVQACDACLPSGTAAIEFVRGGPSWPKNGLAVLGTALLRGSLVAGGLYAAGVRGKELAKLTTAATAAIEAGVIAWAFYTVCRKP